MSPKYIAKNLTQEERESIERSDKAFADWPDDAESPHMAAKAQGQQALSDAQFERQQEKAAMIKQANKD